MCVFHYFMDILAEEMLTIYAIMVKVKKKVKLSP
jgi:hypothetical protein